MLYQILTVKYLINAWFLVFSVMGLSKTVVRDFYYYEGDPDGELSLVAAIWRLIYELKTESPGFMLYLETQIKKSVANVQTIPKLHNVLSDVIVNTLSDDWSWNQIAHLFYALHLIDQHGEFWIVDKFKFREIAIFLVGERLDSIVTEDDWKAIPIITMRNEKLSKQQFSWSTLIFGVVIGYFICKINSK